MADGIYSATSGAVAQQAALEVAAHNLANVNTVGFKGHRLTFEDSVTGAEQSGHDVHVRAAKVVDDFSQGPLKMTEQPLDVALAGPGFFVVETAQGERLTRGGALHQQPDGTLATSDGLAVQGRSGGPIHAPRNGTLRIDATGTVYAGETPIDRLRIVDVADPSQLARESAGTWNPRDQALTPADTPLHPGALEGANVNAVQAMVGLIGIQRAYESYHRAIETMKSSTSRLTNSLG